MQIHVDKYERYWINASMVMLGVFFASLIAGAAIFGVRPASSDGFINPLKLNETQFASPGVRHMGGNQYEVYMLAQTWSFVPAEVRVPVGAEVTFKITSRDVTHGFMIEKTNVNLMVLPGNIAQSRTTFNTPGEFAFVCHEYCGRNHHAMHGVIIVEDTATTNE